MGNTWQDPVTGKGGSPGPSSGLRGAPHPGEGGVGWGWLNPHGDGRGSAALWPPREQGLGPLLTPLCSASLFILLIKPGLGENVLRPGWRGCQGGFAPPFPLLEPVQPLSFVSGTGDEWPSKWDRLGAVTVNHGSAPQVRFPAARRDQARAPTPRRTKTHRIECQEHRGQSGRWAPLPLHLPALRPAPAHAPSTRLLTEKIPFPRQ